MKFLLCGCFHGRVPSKFFQAIKKEKPDLIISTGDYGDGKSLRRWEMKYGDEISKLLLEGKDWGTIINKHLGMKEYLRYVKRDLKTTSKVLNKLKKIKVKYYYTYGNHDGEAIKLLKKYSKRNFRFISKDKLKFKNYTLIFNGGYRGTTGKPYLINWKKASKKHKLLVKKVIFNMNKNLNKLFNKKDKNIIFITHEPPYRTKLDMLKKKYGKSNKDIHIGDDVYTKFDKKFQPLVHVCGHMHENQGYDKIGKTLVINSGALLENKFAILELEKGNIKKLKFYK